MRDMKPVNLDTTRKICYINPAFRITDLAACAEYLIRVNDPTNDELWNAYDNGMKMHDENALIEILHRFGYTYETTR